MCLAFATIILATTTIAAMIGLDRKSNGTVIPLTKRSSWLKHDNSIDFDALHSHVESIDAKILHGLENYERNTGMSHPLAENGAEHQDLKKRDVGAVALTSNRNLVWYGTVTIGTPPQSFTVAIDTGCSDFFLPGPTYSGGSENTRWNPASSRTAEAKGSAFNIKFADGATALGDQYTDTVTIAGLSAGIQTIGAATTYSAKMIFPPDGMLGMAFQSISSYPASPLFETLINEGKVTEPVFSVKLTSEGGELYLGGKNSNLYQGEITYTPVTVVGYWQVNIQKIQGNQQTILGDITATIDTGSNIIVGDQWQVASLHSTLGGKIVGRGYWSFLCNNFPIISFDFGGGRAFQISTSTLNLGPIRAGSPYCFSGIVGWGNRAHWTIGAVFLKSVYTVFDFGNKQVGFADLI